MSSPIVIVKNLSKKYSLGSVHTDLLSEKIGGALRRLIGRENRDFKIPNEDFWALRKVSFEVSPSEVVGVIGRNGAGKSTLLKILSRITSPTEGSVELFGRVASLLEVGTGFHAELTGRENVYLNAAILGMSKHEIRRKFDEIVAFAEVEKFIDTPVKHYSSGMYVRLAFAVAAHLEPEILVVDEVLAVGDVEFQKKCLGKMEEVAEGGRTVFFVSHNMPAIQGLCRRALLLEGGQIKKDGPCEEVIDRYVSKRTSGEDERNGFYRYVDKDKNGNKKSYVLSLEICDENRHSKSCFRMGETVVFRFRVQGISKISQIQIGVTIKSNIGQWLGSFNSGMRVEYFDEQRKDDEYADLILKKMPYTPGIYYIDLHLAKRGAKFLQVVEDAGSFEIVSTDLYGNGYNVTSFYGVTYLDGIWRFSNVR